MRKLRGSWGLDRIAHVCVGSFFVLAACGDDGSGSGGSGGGNSGTSTGSGASNGPGPSGSSSNGAGGDPSGSSGAGGDGSGASGGGGVGGGEGGGGGGTGSRPNPLYPSLDLDTLPGDGGAESGPYEPPELPMTSGTVDITSTGSQAAADIQAACQEGGNVVNVPDSAGNIGGLDLGYAEDCDIAFGPDVEVSFVFVGHLPGPVTAPAHRVRVRGGRIGSIVVDPGSSDIVFDGVTVDNTVVPADGGRSGTGIYMTSDGENIVDRFAFINSVLRMVEVGGGPDLDGCAYLAGGARNVLFANDNIVTAGNRNAWGFRIGGGDNFIIVDSTVRVSFHKLIRMNDGPVDYVYVKGGTWMRENTLTAGGQNINDSFAQLGDLGTDQVFIHDTEVFSLSPEPITFGASSGPGQAGKLWEARGIGWHVLSESVISAASLDQSETYCDAAATCDYGGDTHTYEYDGGLAFPADPWRDLPDVEVDDPDDLPAD